MPRDHIPSRTLGIDLASQPSETGVCLIDWTDGVGDVIDVQRDVLSDEVLIELMRDSRVAKVGIDAPFGWPLAFIDAVTTYRDDGRWIAVDPNEMRFRATETRIFEETKHWPLSVAMSDLAWPAMRCARLLSEIVAGDDVLERSGTGLAVEVYPMAALRRWQIVAAGSASSAWSYKGDKPGRRERRAEHLASLRSGLGGTVRMSTAYEQACIADDDDFDAFVCALVARAACVGRTDPVPLGMQWLALREGWIHLTSADSLPALASH